MEHITAARANDDGWPYLRRGDMPDWFGLGWLDDVGIQIHIPGFIQHNGFGTESHLLSCHAINCFAQNICVTTVPTSFLDHMRGDVAKIDALLIGLRPGCHLIQPAFL